MTQSMIRVTARRQILIFAAGVRNLCVTLPTYTGDIGQTFDTQPVQSTRRRLHSDGLVTGDAGDEY